MISGSGESVCESNARPPASVHVVDLAVLARVNPVAEELRLRSKLSPELSDTYQGQRLMENESAYRNTCRLIPVTDFRSARPSKIASLLPPLVVSIQILHTLVNGTESSIPTGPSNHPQINNERNTTMVDIPVRWPIIRGSKILPMTIWTTKTMRRPEYIRKYH